MLLPRTDGEEAWEDPRAELVRRLLEYQQMREVVDVLERARRGAAQPLRARLRPAGRPRRRRRRSRSRSASCSPPSIACCASRASRRFTTSIPRALDVAGAIVDHARRARAPRARALDATSCRTAPSRGRCSRRCSALLEMAKLRRAAASRSRALSPTWRSRVTPLAKLLEAALFASARPIPTEELAALDPEASHGGARGGARRAARALRRRRPRRRARGGRRRLADPHARRVHRGDRARAARGAARSGCQRAALETLAIIAYRQPIGRAEIEEIRGVSVGSVLKSLHERGLIDVVGRGEGMGRPLLYGTTPIFLEQFALRHLEELPRADELAVALRAVAPRRSRQRRVADVRRADAHPARARARGRRCRAARPRSWSPNGRVTVNGALARSRAERSIPTRDVISVDGELASTRAGAARVDRAEQAAPASSRRGSDPEGRQDGVRSRARASRAHVRRPARLPDRRRAAAHDRRRRRARLTHPSREVERTYVAIGARRRATPRSSRRGAASSSRTASCTPKRVEAQTARPRTLGVRRSRSPRDATARSAGSARRSAWRWTDSCVCSSVPSSLATCAVGQGAFAHHAPSVKALERSC